jgi:hypothetical protein
LAQDSLHGLGRYSDPVARNVQAQLVEVDIQLKQIDFCTGGAYKVPELSRERLEQVHGVSSQNHRGVLKADRASRGTQSVKEEASEAGASSCKIGITFPDCDIDGVSLSQYYCP